MASDQIPAIRGSPRTWRIVRLISDPVRACKSRLIEPDGLARTAAAPKRNASVVSAVPSCKRRQNDDPCLAPQSKPLECFQARHFRHFNVQQHDIRLTFPNLLESNTTIFSGIGDFQIRLLSTISRTSFRMMKLSSTIRIRFLSRSLTNKPFNQFGLTALAGICTNEGRIKSATTSKLSSEEFKLLCNLKKNSAFAITHEVIEIPDENLKFGKRAKTHHYNHHDPSISSTIKMNAYHHLFLPNAQYTWGSCFSGLQPQYHWHSPLSTIPELWLGKGKCLCVLVGWGR